MNTKTDTNTSASPRPWRNEPSGRVGTDCIFDADGLYVATVPKADSQIIVDAVNERDAIRDEHDKLVSGVKSITEGMDNYAATCGDETVAMNIRLYGRAIKAVLKKYEALRKDSAATGEDKP